MSHSTGSDASRSKDHVDRLRAQWRVELPELDTSPMEVLGRVRRLAALTGPPIEAALAKHGLDRGTFDVLAALRRAGPPYRLTPTALYRALLVASGSLTHRLGRLQRAGLVERRSADDDGRSLPVVLTPKGRRCVERAFRLDLACERELLAPLDARERATLATLLKKLNGALERDAPGG